MRISSWFTDTWVVRPHLFRARKVTPVSRDALWISWLRFGVALAWVRVRH